MKLLHLEPRWIQPSQWSEQSPPFHIGISFLCPHCKTKGVCPTCGHFDGKRLAVMFWPPVDPTNSMGRLFDFPENKNAHRRVSGDAFDTLTLSPSVGFDGIGHWHGHITNGEITP